MGTVADMTNHETTTTREVVWLPLASTDVDEIEARLHNAPVTMKPKPIGINLTLSIYMQPDTELGRAQLALLGNAGVAELLRECIEGDYALSDLNVGVVGGVFTMHEGDDSGAKVLRSMEATAHALRIAGRWVEEGLA
jgi:hypothetical protein